MVRSWFLSRPRIVKQALVVASDVVLALVATWLAMSLRLDELHWPVGSEWFAYALAPASAIPVMVRSGLYRAVFRYSGVAVIQALVVSLAFAGAAYFVVLNVLALPGVPRSVGLMQPMVFLLLVGASRLVARHWLSSITSTQRQSANSANLIVYGAGSAGVQIAMALARSHEFNLRGFVDDDAALQGRVINGWPVWSPDELPERVQQFKATDLLLALPSVSRARRNAIIEQVRKLPVHVRSLPALTDLANGKVAVADIHELDVEDLLGRPPVDTAGTLLGKGVFEQVVMVTGAGGSIGSELCRQVLTHAPSRLLLLEHSEYALYAIHRELTATAVRLGSHTQLVPLLCSVQNEARVTELMQSFRPTSVYHAAAYKHVPMVEMNASEGVANNVFGTLNVARAALLAQVRHCVLVSTDKAVRPTNVMGATKRMAELVVQALASVKALQVPNDSGTSTATFPNRTCFSMVRFGNVLGSSGSVVPLFRQQIAAGGPITLTHNAVTRYFMTIPEAVQLVMQAGALSDGGEVFVLDMGEPVRIIDLARRMIELSGLREKSTLSPHGDIEITVTGLRPGEKLYEELLIGDDPQPTAHPRIMKARDEYLPWDQLQPKLIALKSAVSEDDLATIRSLLVDLVHGFKPGELFSESADSRMWVA